jgi:hypothetical protein
MCLLLEHSKMVARRRQEQNCKPKVYGQRILHRQQALVCQAFPFGDSSPAITMAYRRRLATGQPDAASHIFS